MAGGREGALEAREIGSKGQFGDEVGQEGAPWKEREYKEDGDEEEGGTKNKDGGG